MPFLGEGFLYSLVRYSLTISKSLHDVHSESHPPSLSLSLCRLEAVQTEEELSDVYAHFLLYYGRDLVAMRNRGAGRAKGAEAEGEEAGLDGEGKDKPKTTVKQAHRYGVGSSSSVV